MEITVREYAVRKKLSLTSVYQRFWAGRLPARKVDGKWLITIPATEEPKED